MGVILAGGQARRLGGIPKGLLEIDGERIVDRVARALRPLTSRLLLISSHAESRSWLASAEVVADEHPGFGAFAGIATALRAARQDILAVAWDMPFVTSAMLEPLISGLDDHDATMWQGPSGMEPLCACYRQSALPTIDRAIARGVRSARDIASLLRVRALRAEQLANPGEALGSINTPDDLARARQFSRQRHTGPGAAAPAQEEKDRCAT